jgi:Mor family transcriptional regulator
MCINSCTGLTLYNKGIEMRKLTDQDKIDIVHKYNNGDSSVKLSKEYSITTQAILQMLKIRGVKIRNGK